MASSVGARRKVFSATKAIGLALVLFLGIALRLYYVFSSPIMPIGADGFFHSHIISETVSEGSIPNQDPFSWEGRENGYFPGYHFLLASIILSTSIPSSALFLSGPFFFALSFLASIAISRRLGFDSFITSAILSAIPVIVWKTSVNLLPDGLVLFISLVAMFVSRRLSPSAFSIVSVAGLATHHIFIFPFAVSLVLRRKESLSNVMYILATALAVSFSILFFSNATILPSSIHQGVPLEFRAEIFEGANPLSIVYRLGPAVFAGILAFPFKSLELILPIVPAFAKAIELDRALFLSALALIPAGASFLSRRKVFTRILVAMILFAWAFYSAKSLGWAPVSSSDANSLFWISENSPENETIITLPGDGYLVAYVSKRPNSIDGRFFGTKDGDARLARVKDAIASSKAAEDGFGNSSFLLETKRTCASIGALPDGSGWSLVVLSAQKSCPEGSGVYFSSKD